MSLTLSPAEYAIDADESRIVAIECKNVYGAIKAYPVNAAAFTFAKLAGQKTLTRHVLNCAMDLGFSIVSIADADWRNVA